MLPKGAAEKRRSPRFVWRTPIVVQWMAGRGLKVREQAETEIVNAHGGLLRLDSLLPLGTTIELRHPQSSEVQTARVVWNLKEAGDKARAGVELSVPSRTFWGLYVPF